MMRKMMMVATVAMLAGGCSAGMPDDQGVDVAEDDTKADAIFPSGRYENQYPNIGDLAVVTLNADHTYELQHQMVDCIPVQTCAPTKGTYKFTKYGSSRYIRFLDKDGQLLERYAWKLSGSKLSMRLDNTTNWETLVKSAYASRGESCGGNVAMPRQCGPGLECEGNRIPDVPGICVAKLNPCELAGGSCVPLYPGSCTGGTVGDARTYSCGGGLGVECCLPADQPVDSCNTASDCRGALPQYCTLCSNGLSACAHFTCQSHKCVIATCP
jgi:hypothetical protein